MSDLTDVKFFLASLLRPIVREAIREEIHSLNFPASPSLNADPNGDFTWLQSVLPRVPENTIRQWDAAGKIPGSSKFGKRRIYHKETVLSWIRSLESKPVDAAKTERAAEQQISDRLARKGGVAA